MPRTGAAATVVEGRTLREWYDILHSEYDRCLDLAQFHGFAGVFRRHSQHYVHLNLGHVRWRAHQLGAIRRRLEQGGFGVELPNPSVLDTLPEMLRPRPPTMEVLNGTTALLAPCSDEGLAVLPDNLSDLTFGVEFEIILPASFTQHELVRTLNEAGVLAEVESYSHTTRSFWKLTTDSSLRGHGYELVSPILQGQEGIDRMRTVCAVLVGAGCTVNRSCGFHVHVGLQNMDALSVSRRIIGLYATSEEVFDTLVSASRRRDTNAYCRPMTSTVPHLGDLPEAATMADLRRICRTRFRKVNVEALWRHGTIEFRHHQGTVDANKATAWVKLCLKIVDWSRGSDTLPSEIGSLSSLSDTVKLSPAELGYFTRRAARLSTIRTIERR